METVEGAVTAAAEAMEAATKEVGFAAATRGWAARAEPQAAEPTPAGEEGGLFRHSGPLEPGSCPASHLHQK